MNAAVVGHIELNIINLLRLGITYQPIFLGNSNREHIRKNHPATYAKYASVLVSVISNVLKNPDYIGGRNNAIEYVKGMPDGDILKIAVRTSKKGVYFVRTMYSIQQNELNKYLAKNTLVKVP